MSTATLGRERILFCYSGAVFFFKRHNKQIKYGIVNITETQYDKNIF